MDKKKQDKDIYDFDYPQLDLSNDQEEQSQNKQKKISGQPEKKVKLDASNIKSTSKVSNPSSVAPFFPPPPIQPSNSSNLQNWIPPPPVQSKNLGTSSNVSQQRPQYSKPSSHSYNNRDNRQKNNIVYVKNIPKNFNTQQKLMTFFKNQGIIKEIKTKQIEQSATIRFLKDQQALKFLKSNKFIFNRSFIVYGSKDNLTVTQQQIQDRITDEQGIIKKAEQTNMKVMKDKVISQLAEQIRTLYFFQKHLCSDNDYQTQQLRKLILDDLSVRMELKNALQNQSEERKLPFDQFLEEYNRTLKIKRQYNEVIQKKTLFAEFLVQNFKYGPIISLQSQYEIKKSIHYNDNNTQKSQQKQNQCQIYDYEIKLQYLSLKNFWCYYNMRKDESVMFEGKKVQRLFDSGKLKTIEMNRQVEETKKVDGKDELLKNLEKEDNKPHKPTVINFVAEVGQVETIERTQN